VILSDFSIREQLQSGRIVIEPLGESAIQPSSVDLRVDRYFRVFRNDTTPYIDPKQPQEDLTELVEVDEGRAFILHPGEFVLGSTLERVALADDLVARLEGKSSLGRLGLLIHSSLPGSERVMLLRHGRLAPRRIEEIVRGRLEGSVVAFDPESFRVGFHEVTGWYEGPPDRIYEIRLASGRRVRVTAGHNLFTIDGHGRLTKARTLQLKPGARVAIPRLIPDPPARGRRRPSGLAPSLPIDLDLAWLLGLYVAEGSRRRNQVTFANTDPSIIAQVERILGRHGVPTSHSRWAITACSGVLSEAFAGLGMGEDAGSKRMPQIVFSWPSQLAESFLDGLVDGEGSRTDERISVWTTSEGLVSDLLVLSARLGRRAGSCVRYRPTRRPSGSESVAGRPLWQVYLPNNEHKLLTSVPLPDRLLVGIRNELGVDQATASRMAGYRHPTSLANVENRSGRDAVRTATLRRLRSAYARRPDCPPSLPRLDRLVDGELLWDEVVEVYDTGSVEPIFDLEVQPGGRKIENFLAGDGGVFVSNTAGFVDAGWDGHLTLELSNVANLPIAIYPGMKIGQISFLQMTGPAEAPYGSDAAASKYKGQRGPTPSRYYLNFPPED
jgi:deoxycytidine triphosphate deaminase